MAKSDETDKKQDVKVETPKVKTAVFTNSHTRNILFIVAGVLVLAAVFLGGMQAADNRRGPSRLSGFGFGPETRSVGPRMRGGYGGSANTQNGIVITGKVSSVNGNDFIVDQNGSSKTVKTDSNTAFRGVGISGLKSGDQVSVAGSTNSDGSIQAISVSVGITTTSSSAPSSSESGATESF